MTTVLAGAESRGLDQSDPGIIWYLRYLTITYYDPEFAVGNYGNIGFPNYISSFGGYGFEMGADGVLVSGTITGYYEYNGSGNVLEIWNVRIPVASLVDAVRTENYSFYQSLFDGDDWLGGSSFRDRLHGGAGNDTIIGGSGADDIMGGPGDDSLFGDDGIDRFDFQSLRKSNTISTLMNYNPNYADIQGPEGRDTIHDFEIIRFVDGSLHFYATSAPAETYRAYISVFGREPDAFGFNFWSDRLEAGEQLSLIAEFTRSEEFKLRYGNLTDEQFVEQAYLTVFGRTADVAGLQHWTGALDAGSSRTAVLDAFSQSEEMAARTRPVIDAGLWNPDEVAVSVARVYVGLFGRDPDAAGQIAWTAAAYEGLSTEGVIEGFLNSEEYRLRFPVQTSTALITELYESVLGRKPAQFEVEFWLLQVDQGVSQAGVISQFTDSMEFQLQTAPMFSDGIDFI